MNLTAAPPDGATTGTRGPIHVLVVEDSLDHQTLMRRRLEQAGMRVAVASDAEEALASIDEVDLVLLDYRLPGDTGLELLEQINDRRRPPSVIMVTGAGSTDVAVEAMRRGAIDYVAKDRGYLDDLPEVVHRAWRHHDLTQRASELQRLALLVSSARDRDALFDEIVSGARRLLRARTCALLLEEHGQLSAATVLGDEPDDLAELQHREVSSLDPDDGPVSEGERLLVPLPRDGGVPLGVLAVWSDGGDGHDVEELQLARAFASFVGIALRNLRQRELEQALVSELQQTVDARRDFIASVSHELRTPLTCILGFVDTLDHAWGQMQAEARLDMLKRIGRNAVDLKVLVDELIDLAALDRGRSFKIELETLQMHEQARRSIDDAAEILGDREVLLELDEVSARADESLVRRTMTNLLTNAVKFSDEGSPLRVGVTTDGDAVRVEVEDHGIGMEPQQAARVFDPFFRANPSVANAVRGSGIGLALVKEYVRTMGGRVGVQSEPGVGSTFWFTLPRAE